MKPGEWPWMAEVELDAWWRGWHSRRGGRKLQALERRCRRCGHGLEDFLIYRNFLDGAVILRR
jgi:hypothetical protein